MQKTDIKIIKEKKSCQRSLWFLTLNTTPFQLVKIGAKNFGTGFRNTYFGWFGWFALICGWFGWFLGGLDGFWVVSNFSNNGSGNEINDPNWIGLCLFIPWSRRHSEKQTWIWHILFRSFKLPPTFQTSVWAENKWMEITFSCFY